MKKNITFLIAGLFIISGLMNIASSEGIESKLSLKSNDYKITIAPISFPNSQNKIINGNIKSTNEELFTYQVSYKQNSNKLSYNKEIKKQDTQIGLPNFYQTYDYVIITTDELYSAIDSSMFLDWKAFIGYKVKIVNTTDDEIATQTGQDLPEKIRNFLREYYQSWGIEYVLIVGNHATIPMRYCYPDPTNHRFDIFDYTSGEVPTDYYYADLSSSDSDSWDSDGDGYYG